MARRTKATANEHNQLGASLFQSGAVDLAVEQFRLAVKRIRWVPTYWLNLGVALTEKGEIDEAESALHKALSLDPKCQSAHYHLAQIYKMRRDDEAVRHSYEKTIEIDPNTYLAQRAREYLDDWRPKIVVETK